MPACHFRSREAASAGQRSRTKSQTERKKERCASAHRSCALAHSLRAFESDFAARREKRKSRRAHLLSFFCVCERPSASLLRKRLAHTYNKTEMIASAPKVTHRAAAPREARFRAGFIDSRAYLRPRLADTWRFACAPNETHARLRACIMFRLWLCFSPRTPVKLSRRRWARTHSPCPRIGFLYVHALVSSVQQQQHCALFLSR